MVTPDHCKSFQCLGVISLKAAAAPVWLTKQKCMFWTRRCSRLQWAGSESCVTLSGLWREVTTEVRQGPSSSMTSPGNADPTPTPIPLWQAAPEVRSSRGHLRAICTASGRQCCWPAGSPSALPFWVLEALKQPLPRRYHVKRVRVSIHKQHHYFTGCLDTLLQVHKAELHMWWTIRNDWHWPRLRPPAGLTWRAQTQGLAVKFPCLWMEVMRVWHLGSWAIKMITLKPLACQEALSLHYPTCHSHPHVAFKFVKSSIPWAQAPHSQCSGATCGWWLLYWTMGLWNLPVLVEIPLDSVTSQTCHLSCVP